MIHYQLRCAAGHEFDGWFKDSAGFDNQIEAGLVVCPHCGSAEVGRALMTPGIPRKSRPEPDVLPPEPVVSPAAGGLIPDSVRVALHKLREEVEKHCDYVGTDFAEEARRIHNGETEARGIYGESTDEEAEALAEDGIAFARIPWVPRSDS
ncbi:DUF1178 family protein [Acidocella sp. KAb 2-4]|uniref:DUF1178 family protein n=1 Tax=Acidocella sp. KAb 2-4 TaxID=2885158 RepID=UPI001D05E880|nr:DUF1178 family protein [Acidocella sp. KAb 2-4]MCB5944913.1 DUF1178 family protein [Acidocella sp. KAb 2-4]